ncbi:hypothetical protein QUB25_05615 [Microcoleus sp. B3-D7]
MYSLRQIYIKFIDSDEIMIELILLTSIATTTPTTMPPPPPMTA